MRVAILGCGYVGASLAREAVDAGWDVWALTRNKARLEGLTMVPKEQRIAADLHGDDWHEQLSGDFDVVWNLVSSAGGGLTGYEVSYVEGNRSIRRWASGRKVGHFIYTSATSVYPQTDGEWVSEENVPDLESLSPSGRILRIAEQEIERFPFAERTLVVRLGGIYGPGRHLYLDRLREGAPCIPGDGSGWLNLIYLKDITRALLDFGMREGGQAFDIINLVDNEPARKQEIADWLAGRLGVAGVPFDSGAVTSRTARRTISGKLPNRRVSNRKSRNVLGWEPCFASYREGYADILSGLRL